MEGPVAQRFRPTLHLTDGGWVCRPTGVELPPARHLFQRVDVLVHEAADAVAQALDLLGNGEIHERSPGGSVSRRFLASPRPFVARTIRRRRRDGGVSPSACSGPAAVGP